MLSRSAPLDQSPVIVTGIRGQPVTRSPIWPAVLGLLAACLAWLRLQPDVRDTLYAEDGVLFVHDQAVRGGVSLLWEPYAGYQHLIPRSVAWFVTTFLPVPLWGLAVVLIACAIVGVIAALVFVYSGDVIAYYPSRIVLGLMVALIPVAGMEALGNLANLHWFLLYLMPWVLMSTPRSRVGIGVAVVVALLATATEPQCVIFAPLVIWRFATFPRTRLVMGAWAVGIAFQALTYLTAPRVQTAGRPPLASIADGYVLQAGMSIVTSRGYLLGQAVATAGWWIGFAWVAGILAFAAVGFVQGRTPARAMLLTFMLGSLASWTLSLVVNNFPQFYYSQMTPEQLNNLQLGRWATAASLMLAATVPVAVAALIERHPRWWPAGVTVLGLMMLAMVVNLAHRPVVQGPLWSDQIEAGKVVCATTPDATIDITAAPKGWVLGLPCSVVTS